MLAQIGMIAIAALGLLGFAPAQDQCAVNVRYTSSERSALLVEGETYALTVDLAAPSCSLSKRQGAPLLGQRGACFLVRASSDGARVPVSGPGRVNIYSFGTQMYEAHVRDLKAEGISADIELALYCYAKRVFVNLDAVPRDGAPPVETIIQWTDFPGAFDASACEESAWDQRISGGQYEAARYTPSDSGAASAALLIGSSPADLANLLSLEANPGAMLFSLEGGHYDGYQARRGFHQITTDYRGPRGFEEAWINPNQRYEVALEVSCPKRAGRAPAEIVCNVRNTYGVLEGALLTDKDGFPLPVQVQVSKNFAGENEEGPREGDVPYGEAYFPLTVSAEAPFAGRVYHLFGNWGTHPLVQLSSIRFFHHYFHCSVGPTETFCFVPFEFPRDDGRDYFMADVRGLSNVTWPGQPQHDHVSVIGILRYLSGGQWVNNLLEDTRIYLTSPNLYSFALDYLTEDGKAKTTLEVFGIPEDDEARCFIKMTTEVLDTIPIDGGTAHGLRFLNAGAYIVHTQWPHIAYTSETGATVNTDVPAGNAWVLEGVPLGKEAAFTAAYAHPNGNMCFFVNKFDGVLGGKAVDNFGLSCFGGTEWTEMFLTAPGNLERLEKGDHFTAHLFVMPYGRADVDYRPAERQRALYGKSLARTEVIFGEKFPNRYPPHVKADPRGFAEFTVAEGANWTPLVVEGFKSHKAPMLWENRGEWLFIDQQIYGNDWYQTYEAADGSIGYVFLVRHRPGMTHRYLVTCVENATAITQRNGFVTVTGGPFDFVSPVRFEGLECAPVPGTDLYRCTGAASCAVSR